MSKRSPPRNVGVFLLDGDPNGIQVAEISNRPIQAISFRRNQLQRVRDDLESRDRHSGALGRRKGSGHRGIDIRKKTGVYILYGTDKDEVGRQTFYIGESINVGKRLSDHNSSTEEDEKFFWTDTVVFIAKDASLNKGDVLYVEARLLKCTIENPQWLRPPGATPSPDAGGLSVQSETVMDEFIDEAKILAGVLGLDLFRNETGAAQETSSDSDPRTPDRTEFVYKSGNNPRPGREWNARMVIGSSGDFVVMAGSRVALEETGSTLPYHKNLRTTLRETGILQEDGRFLNLSRNYSFNTTSEAAVVVAGTPAAGPKVWKQEPSGLTYDEWVKGMTD